jgi:prepilin-type N-terminal cleavage/methylation domain-containing protein
MLQNHKRAGGFTLIELLVVLTILGILTVMGSMMVTGSRSTAAVRSVMDELEGTLLSAQKLAVATGQDVTLASQGNWSGTDTTPLILAFSAVSPPNPPAIVAAGATDPASFKLAQTFNGTTPVALARDHAYAGIVVGNSGWWTTAMQDAGGKINTDITTVPPFKKDATDLTQRSAFSDILSSSLKNLFQGGSAQAYNSTDATATNSGFLQISGSSKRFQSTMWIKVVGLRGGAAYPGAPMGLLVVLANGGTVYKFYNPGVATGDGKWRKM